jgi:hypothetical protein
MPNIVVSYRRDDSKWIAGRVFDHLEAQYGKGRVFMDIDSIPYGLDFREHIRNTLDRCDILVVVIGPRWLETNEEGHARILAETDWVRIEIEAALARKIPVIPALIDRARMPKPSELPESMQSFAFRQAADIDSGRDFRAHMERLIRSMNDLLKTVQAQAPPPPEHRLPQSRQSQLEPTSPPPVGENPSVTVPAEPAATDPTVQAERAAQLDYGPERIASWAKGNSALILTAFAGALVGALLIITSVLVKEGAVIAILGGAVILFSAYVVWVAIRPGNKA